MAIEHSKVLTSHFIQPHSRSSSDEDTTDIVNPLFEVALQKTPLLLISIGDIANGLKKFRELLEKRHLHSIILVRQSLLKKFSECLMSSTCEYNYLRFDKIIVAKNEK
jgi:hypothetical protein